MAAAPSSVDCPNCGAPRSLANPGIVTFVCEYCNTPVYWDDDALRIAGEKSRLTEGFTRLYRGARGTYHSTGFQVLGRVRYDHGRGFTDEWYLELATGKTAWMTEDDHQLAVQKAVSLEQTSRFSQYSVGMSLRHRDSDFMVIETGSVTCVGLEGELPEIYEIGESYDYVDASSYDGRYALGFEFDDGPDAQPHAFLGRWLKNAELRLEDEGSDW